jgi:hypothetical protein
VVKTYVLRSGVYLIDRWADPAVVFAGHDDLSNLKGGEVGDAEADELALLVQLVDGLEGLRKRRGAILEYGSASEYGDDNFTTDLQLHGGREAEKAGSQRRRDGVTCDT